MRAVLSYWSAPTAARATVGRRSMEWPHDVYAALAWCLSTTLARRWFDRVELVTDTAGAAYLVDALGLPVTDVTTGLDALDRVDPRMWTAGKLAAYAAQTTPFLHLDSDVFLTKPLPPAVLGAPVVAQSVEALDVPVYGAYYLPTMAALRGRLRSVPTSWVADEARPLAERPAYNLGVVGGHDLGALRDYARTALGVLTDTNATTGLMPSNVCVTAEQYVFGAEMRARGRAVTTLIPPAGTDDGERQAAALGYVHLFGDAKRRPDVLDRLMRRALDECPALARRCLALHPLER